MSSRARQIALATIAVTKRSAAAVGHTGRRSVVAVDQTGRRSVVGVVNQRNSRQLWLQNG
jgi:hypothetical protein